MFCRKCGNKLTDDSAFCNKCGEPVEAGVATQTAAVPQRVDNSIDKLGIDDTMKYLDNVCKLENDRYALIVSRDELQRKLDTYGIRRTIYEPITDTSGYHMFSAWLLLPILAVLGYFLFRTVVLGIIVYLIVEMVLWELFGKKVAVKNKENKKKYKKDIQDDIARVEHENSLKPMLEQHINDINREIASLTQTIDKLYDYDILYPKYRNDVVAVNTIYEYLLTGMASSLSAKYGNDGAYNIYENHRRMDVIIYKLDNIINQLEQIKANQHMLYEAVQEACSVSAKIADMAEHISSIDQNTALSAYYSKVSADNTATLNYMALMSM